MWRISLGQYQDREDVEKFLSDLLRAVAEQFSSGCARVRIGYSGSLYDVDAAELEGFSRPLWGIASFIAGRGEFKDVQKWLRGFTSGSDPDNEEFWGHMRKDDQRMVECAAIGFSIAIAKSQLWDPLSDEAKENLETWLSEINCRAVQEIHCLWSRVFVNLGLQAIGSSTFQDSRMKEDLDHLDSLNDAQGWSRLNRDGDLQFDSYSSSMTTQFYQLVYSKLARDIDPARCEDYRAKARIFAEDYICYFDAEGRAVPFGKSTTYRFAISSFWSAVAFADVELPEPLTWGVVKGLQLRNLRYWIAQEGAYFPNGILTLGFCYPNFHIVENNHSPASPYWCLTSFLTLALPKTHPFWSATEEPYPSSLLNTTKSLNRSLHITTNFGGHTYILTSGQQCSYPLKHGAAKYGKFAYSSAFGFSVPVGTGSLAELGGDNTLALSDDGGETWKCRDKMKNAHNEGGKWLKSFWYPWKDVEVETWLIPPAPDSPLWHLRVHRLKSCRSLLSAEGGFAIYGQGKDRRALEPSVGEDFGYYEEDCEARATSRAGVSGIVDVGSGERKGRVLRTDPNTNLIVSRAVLPNLLHEHKQSGRNTWLVTAVFALPSEDCLGQQGAKSGWMTEWKKRPKVPKEIMAKIMLMYVMNK